MSHQPTQQKPLDDQSSFEDSDDDMFGNLAPTTNKTSLTSPTDQQNKLLMAKMKRLIGTSFITTNTTSTPTNQHSLQKYKQKYNKNQNNKKKGLSQQSHLQSQNESVPEEPRERSRDKNALTKTADSIKSNSGLKKVNSQNAANLSIQKQVVKQNDNLTSNKINERKDKKVVEQKGHDIKKLEKLDKFAEIEKLLFVPVKELPMLRKSSEEMKQERRQKKRLDRMIEKKYKEYKVGKVKDQASNCVFNGIEDYFN